MMSSKENGQFFKPDGKEELFSEKRQVVFFGEGDSIQLSLPENLGMDSIWEWNRENGQNSHRAEEHLPTK